MYNLQMYNTTMRTIWIVTLDLPAHFTVPTAYADAARGLWVTRASSVKIIIYHECKIIVSNLRQNQPYHENTTVLK